MVMKWPVAPVSATQLDVNIVNGCGVVARAVDGEGTETLGVMMADVIWVTDAFGLGSAVLITENARGGSVGPLT